jgi:hypothetical protein
MLVVAITTYPATAVIYSRKLFITLMKVAKGFIILAQQATNSLMDHIGNYSEPRKNVKIFFFSKDKNGKFSFSNFGFSSPFSLPIGPTCGWM